MADINEKLRKAARAGSEYELKALLRDTGCDAFSTDNYGMTALMWAASNGHEECIRILLPASDVFSRDENGWTALIWTNFNGYDASVRLLLPTSNTLAKANDGRTALMQAAIGGHEACVRLLLPVSDALAENEYGHTASTRAREEGHEVLAQFIDSYIISQSELVAIESTVGTGAARSRIVPRV